MGLLLQQDLIPGAAVDGEGDLIAHGTRRQEEGRLLAQEFRHHLLEQVDHRVFPQLLVAHVRFAHEPPHRRRGAGHGITEQVDRYHSIFSMVRSAIRRGTIVAVRHTTAIRSAAKMSAGVIATG